MSTDKFNNYKKAMGIVNVWTKWARGLYKEAARIANGCRPVSVVMNVKIILA